MKRWLWALGLIGMVALITFMLSNSQINLSLAAENESSLKVETSFPNATCSKTLSRTFPFAVIHCEEAAPLTQDSGNESLDYIELPETQP